MAITVVTELAAAAGVFSSLVERLAGWGLTRRWILWLFVLALATVSTIFLSLDTTAVLVTPVVVLLAIHVGVPPMPFALATIWLANTASLLLPVSNLTNLLAESRMGAAGPAGFASLVWAPALVGILVPVLVLTLLYRRSLTGRYVVPARTPVADAPLLATSAVVVVLLLPLLVSGLPVWMPATAAAIVLLAVFAIRRRGSISIWLVPWRPVAIAFGLFVLVVRRRCTDSPLSWAAWPVTATTSSASCSCRRSERSPPTGSTTCPRTSCSSRSAPRRCGSRRC